MLETIFYYVGGITIITGLGVLSVVFLYLIYVGIKKLTQFYYGIAVMTYRLNKMNYKEQAILQICFNSIVKQEEKAKKRIEKFYEIIF